MLVVLATVCTARADIYQWEFIDPSNPSQGRQLSAKLAPDGAGLFAAPGANLTRKNLTKAYLNGAKLENSFAFLSNFTEADFTRSTLSGANFLGATLSGAEFTDADVSQANLSLYHEPISFIVAGAANDQRSRFYLTYGTGVTLSQLYSTASYRARALRGIGLSLNELDGGNFAAQDLTNADFVGATLLDANFAGAVVTGAQFSRYRSDVLGLAGTGISLEQIYSTTSYGKRDLHGIGLSFHDLVGGYFSGQGLHQANLTYTNLSNAELSQANLTGANLYGAHLDSVSLAHATLTDANLNGADLTNTDFSDAVIQGANFSRAVSCNDLCYTLSKGISLPQLYSTASYKAGNLSGIGFDFHDLSGANLAGKNLTNANFSAVTLTSANLNAADARGALALELPSSATVENLIRPDGRIDGLRLATGHLLTVRDYDGDLRYASARPPVPIVVNEEFTCDPASTLRMEFEADDWDSTISFAPEIPVALGGTLQLTFANGVNPAEHIGRTFHLFDWTGVNPVGAFSVDSDYRWDFSHFYDAGEVTLIAVPEPNVMLPMLLPVAALVAIGRTRPSALSH
ncbi:MAG: pentapeptide repeat-containing protein [Pirellulales bacterium]